MGTTICRKKEAFNTRYSGSKIYKYSGNVRILRPVFDAWIAECNTAEMGIDLDEKIYEADLQKLVDNTDSDLLVLKNEDEIVGFLGLQIFDSPLGKQKLANEHYFYILPPYRGIAGTRMIKTAIEWARQKNCSHLILNASNLASDLHDKTCKLYSLLEFSKFETSFIMKT